MHVHRGQVATAAQRCAPAVPTAAHQLVVQQPHCCRHHQLHHHQQQQQLSHHLQPAQQQQQQQHRGRGSRAHALPPQLLAQLAAGDAAPPAALGLVLPALGALVGGALFLRVSLYSQLEVITAKMLSKYVPSGGARVLQLGGGSRELYYYPKSVVLVVNVGERVNKGLMEQAGVTAAVPTQAKQQPVTDLSFQPDASVDAVVALGALAQLGSDAERAACLRECARVLRPGRPLVFVEPVAEGGSPLRGLIGVSGGGSLPRAQLDALGSDRAFSYSQLDVALAGQDPHAVGVAVRSEQPLARGTGGDNDDDSSSSSSKARRAKQPKTAQGFSSS